jgi:RHS repeat-associated protein
LADSDSNGVTHKYIYGKGLLAVVTSAGRYCYHFNATGSTVALTDVNQNVVNSYAYDPFGTVLNQQEMVPQPFKYVGQYGVMAEPNGLYYMRARYYDPSVGRFISEDPLGFGGGDVNLFAYVQNNAVNRVDPYGLAQAMSVPGGPPFFIPPGSVFEPGSGPNKAFVSDVNSIVDWLSQQWLKDVYPSPDDLKKDIDKEINDAQKDLKCDTQQPSSQPPESDPPPPPDGLLKTILWFYLQLMRAWFTLHSGPPR